MRDLSTSTAPRGLRQLLSGAAIVAGTLLLLAANPAVAATAVTASADYAPLAAQAPVGAEFEVVEASGTSLADRAKGFAVKGNESFRVALSRWALQEGWNLSWELPAEYTASFDAELGADFLSAVDAVMASLNQTGVQARARAYAGNKVLRIVIQGSRN